MMRATGAALLAAILGAALVACSAAGAVPASKPSAAQSQASSSTSSVDVLSQDEAPIAGDPFPSTLTNGTATFATCVPVYDSYDITANLWTQVGCTTTADLDGQAGYWEIDDNANAECELRWDAVSGDVVLFWCTGNPY